MPNALAVANVARHNLKSLEGAYVDIKRMTYGQKLERQGMIKVSFEMNKGRKDDMKGQMEMANRIATYYEFKHCIVDHNLTDDQDNKLDLSNQFVIDSLDPRVGEEINGFINDMNNFEDDKGN